MKLRHLLAAFAVSVAPAATYAAPASSDPWWNHAVIYEIYPRSFADSNGDGVGDLNGITAHLDYLHKLGVTAIWLTPMFPSPQVDFGYDVADYEAVDPQYGTMGDLDHLQAEAKKRGIKLILDMVLNHTSDKDKWFEESASSRTNPKADWYVWNDGLPADAPGVTAYQKRFEHDGRVPPNNWASSFGGSAWEWVPARKQFYFHHFYKEQPDLNWRNPAVEKAMFGVLRFWLDRGIAGFRLDAITTLFEDPQLRNQPETGGTNAFGDPNEDIKYIDNLPEVHGVMQRMRKLVDSYPGNRVLIGETYLPNTAALKQWYGTAAQPELHVPMDMLVGFGGNEYTPAHFRPRLKAAETQLDGHQPLFVFDNHDNVRSIDRYGDGTHDVAIAKGIATMLFGSRATAMTYYGAELGMRTETPTRKEDVRDPIGIVGWPNEKGRDGERTPMQWTAGAQAGFSTNSDTWLPIPVNHSTINVATEETDPASLFNWYRTLIGLRAREPALRDGAMVMADANNPDVLAWRRTVPGGGSVLVAINMADHPATFDPGVTGTSPIETLAISDGGPAPQASKGAIALRPYASWIGKLR